jgi:hypothetical protein
MPWSFYIWRSQGGEPETVGDMPRPKMLSSSESIAPKGCAAVGGSAAGPSQRKRDRVITFLLPVFLHFPAFVSTPRRRPQPHPMGAAPPLCRGWGRAAPSLGSPSESLIEGGVASMIPLKQNHISALIVSTGFGLAPCRGRHGDRLAASRTACPYQTSSFPRPNSRREPPPSPRSLSRPVLLLATVAKR